MYKEIILNESGLARIRQHLENHDCAIINAFRKVNIDCVDEKCFNCSNDKTPVSKEECLERNKELKAALLGLYYGVTDIDGSWIVGYGSPDAKESKENSLFVVNLEDHSDFFERIIYLGRYYCQDSVLIKARGEDDAYLYGTNNAEYPGYGKKINVGHFKGGFTNEFLSKIKGRPFIFQESSDYSFMVRGLIFGNTRDRIFKTKPKG